MDRSAILDLFDAYADATADGVYDEQTEQATFNLVAALLPTLRGLPSMGEHAPRIYIPGDLSIPQGELNSLLRHAFCTGVKHGHQKFGYMEVPDGAPPEIVRGIARYNQALTLVNELRPKILGEDDEDA